MPGERGAREFEKRSRDGIPIPGKTWQQIADVAARFGVAPPSGNRTMKVAVNGFDMNYKIEGPADAPWLTFANSLVTSLEMWDEQARALKDRYRVLRYDMRGHGRSDAPPPPYTHRGTGERRARRCGARSGSIAAIGSGCRSAA